MNRLLLPLCLSATWIIWGSTYLAVRFALVSFPPFLLSGIRYLIAGSLMLLIMRWRKVRWPSSIEIRNATLIGFLMTTVGNGLVCVAEQKIASGAAALIVAATPVMAVLFNQLLGSRTRWIEWLGIGAAVGGMVLMNLDNGLNGEPAAVCAVIAACIAWALASALTPRLQMPHGIASATVQMLAGGALSIVVALSMGERMQGMPDRTACLALLWLIVGGSMLAYTAYVWLLRNIRPALATSSCYVNPVVALALGALLGGEQVSIPLLIGMGIILGGVALIGLAHRSNN